MPQVNIKPNPAPNNEWRETMHRFDGSWMPDIDGALISANIKIQDSKESMDTLRSTLRPLRHIQRSELVTNFAPIKPKIVMYW